MKNFSNYFIARVKSFCGLKSIDPPLPFDDFLEKNFKKLKKMLDKDQLMVIDKDGNEVDKVFWKDQVLSFYQGKIHTIKLLENNKSSHDFKLEKLNYESQLRENLKLIKKLRDDEQHKSKQLKKVTVALQESDNSNLGYLKRKTNVINQQLKELEEKRAQAKSEIGKIYIKLDAIENNSKEQL